MERISEKVFLQLNMPTEDVPLSDEQRIRLALQSLGYQPVVFPLHILRRLYPLCRNAGFDITVTLVRREADWVITHLESGDTRQHHYALAVDYGSTTVIMQLVDLHSGAIIGEERAVNGQTRYGTDILSRITYALEAESHMDDLQQVTVQTFDALLCALTESTGISAASCPVMIVSGNTTMVHFLLKLDAWTVFASPYAPVTTDPGFFWGKELDMVFEGLVYLIPSASNYVGGDIISGLLTLNIHKQEETAMFFDIGTNGELVIGNKHWMMAGAGAAGPALEGYISKFGMRAAPGAVDSVRITGQELSFTTIGGEKAVGICGSGIIDLLAQMRLAGWINIAGELDPKASPRIRYLPEEEQYAAVYALPEESESGKMLYFSQQDILQYLDTKAAAFTMVESLMESAGVVESDLAHCYLSGAFPRPFGSGVRHYHRHFPGSSPSKVFRPFQYLSGRSEIALAGPLQAYRSAGSGPEHLLRPVCLHPGLSGADAGSQIHPSHGSSPVPHHPGAAAVNPVIKIAQNPGDLPSGSALSCGYRPYCWAVCG